MQIVFVSNFFNHHQQPIADELHKLSDGNYTFVELEKMPDSFNKTGYPIFQRQYILKAWESKDKYDKARKLILEADVVVFGGILHFGLIEERQKDNKLTFEYSERWFKKGIVNILSPNLWRWWWNYKYKFKNLPTGLLCAGAYCKKDHNLLGFFYNQCYKWGYFTQHPEIDLNTVCQKFKEKHLKIIWVARFIKLKHPEIVVRIASLLKNKGIDFEINMYGNGPLKNRISEEIRKKELEDVVKLQGNKPNNVILQEMSKSHIFLFTSDKNEGWGAVLNEAMSNVCCVVADKRIGSVPYLIENGVSGFSYSDFSSLVSIMNTLIDNKKLIEATALNGYQTITHDWSPKNAAKNLYKLFESFLYGTSCDNIKGPASKDL